jgi:hypothetical protein
MDKAICGAFYYNYLQTGTAAPTTPREPFRIPLRVSRVAAFHFPLSTSSASAHHYATFGPGRHYCKRISPPFWVIVPGEKVLEYTWTMMPHVEVVRRTVGKLPDGNSATVRLWHPIAKPHYRFPSDLPLLVEVLKHVETADEIAKDAWILGEIRKLRETCETTT